MKLLEYLQNKLSNINLELYFKIQNISLLKYIAQIENLDYVELCKKYIKSIDPYKYIISCLADRLKEDLKRDPEFRGLDIDDLINSKVDEHIEKTDFIHKEIEFILNDIFDPSIKKNKKFINYTLSNLAEENTINILLKHLNLIFKNKTIKINRSMDYQITADEFELIYNKVFRPYYTTENNNKLRQKKFRLKNKLVKGCVNKEEDYEIILFKYILNNSI